MKKNLGLKINKPETSQFEKRRQSRLVVYTELVFVLLPFFLLILRKPSYLIIYEPEWSLAAALLFGQAAARLFSGIAKNKVPNGLAVVLYGVIFVACSILCVYNYSLIENSIDNQQPPPFLYVTFQTLMFFLSLIVFAVFGAIGQRIMDLDVEKKNSK